MSVVVEVRPPGIRIDRLRRLVRHVLRREQSRREPAARAATVTVALVSDGTIRRLNRRFLGKNRATDVLAFPGDPPHLGDVVISVPRARMQARRAGHAPAVEVALLAAHGTLHLLGYDDRSPRQRGNMWRRQVRLLGELGMRVRR
ncbi:MAG: rRNA maturation RNase YbeY [Armatimonadota bacterium]|nr:rRNA maturation RNase YbeY [Armatimonadota bacterium]MDR7466840.1 rRNA maturation RNase YbeY [Armatimonadota bacterium]MDR7492687.1 rRNA maturation RNase YbeY [Armatimonadota bacterium]MDR7504242.1 rRNA maturation RNase YbeY [Armatimonadota bacterium]MDR7546861.1 rRNA maturation RNase YbeY [Armatimonadota bacterium]